MDSLVSVAEALITQSYFKSIHNRSVNHNYNHVILKLNKYIGDFSRELYYLNKWNKFKLNVVGRSQAFSYNSLVFSRCSNKLLFTVKM